MSFENIPVELRALNQWVCWKSELRDGKVTKVPYRSGKKGEIKAKADNPDTWGPFDHAVRRIETYKDMDGIGFVFTRDDPYIGIDLDDSDDWGEVYEDFNTYAELSPSGHGIHIIGRGTLPIEGSGKHPKGVGAFQHSRYFTFTGNAINDDPLPIRDIQRRIDQYWPIWFPETPEPAAPAPSSQWFAHDEEIVAKLRNETNPTKFDALWRGEIDEYGGDTSAADLALCSKITFYTQDRDQVSRIFAQSALGQREKWQKRPDYREMTISRALIRSEFYTPPTNTLSGVTIIRSKTEEGEEKSIFTFNTTDKGNSLRVLHHYGDTIRYCHAMKTWMVWNGRAWSGDEDDEIMRICMATGETIYDEAESVPSDELRKLLRKWAIATEGERKLVAMARLTQSHNQLKIRADQLDADSYQLNVENGTINLLDGSFHPHQRSDYLTKLAPVTFDPQAACPIWDAFLDRIFEGKADVIGFVQKALGYALTGDVTERSFFMLYGAGRNGKSTLVETIARIMGDYAISSSADLVAARKGDAKMPTDLARLMGIRFTMAAETGEYSRMDEARVKNITGGDRIVAERKYQNPFEFDPTFKIWLSTNHQPNIRGIDEGIWDRIKLIPFTYRIPDEDVDRYLKDKLLREASGILNWLVDGCLSWQQEGLGIAESITSATREYRASMDSIGSFLSECCIVDAVGSIPIGELYQSYTTWAKDSGEFPASKRALTNRLRDRGLTVGPHGKRNIVTLFGARMPFPSEDPSFTSRYTSAQA